jgi:GT2 family glycosyltransferase
MGGSVSGAQSGAAEWPLPQPLCSIVIPVHNKASLTRQCLNALLEMPYHATRIEVIVVDDASTDGTSQLLARYGARIRVLRPDSNGGFARACNVGAAAANGEYLVFLNNDTLPHPDWLDALVRYATRHSAAVVGSKLLYPNETIQHAGVVIGQNRAPHHIYRGFPADHPAVNVSRRYQIVTGACMLVRRLIFEQCGGFDTAYLNGHEDVDLCLRLGELGHEVHYCHESVLTHLESVSRGFITRQDWTNARIYKQRWQARVQPDDLRYYVEDGLLRLGYRFSHPFDISVDPLLANVANDARDRLSDQLLATRARQVNELQYDNTLLSLRLQEAEYAAGAALPGRPSLPAAPVTIVLPVRDDFDALEATLESLAAQTDLATHPLLLIDDGSRDERVRPCLETFARQQRNRARFRANAERRGLAGCVNRALTSPSDIVLLTAGTLLTPRWLEKLQAAAYARPAIASVAPLSSGATLCGQPLLPAGQAPQDGIAAQRFAEFIERSALSSYPNLPAATGPCVYLTLAALREVGPFDEARFATDNDALLDWSLRAARLGYAHTLDDATYLHQLAPAPAAAHEQPDLLSALYPEYARLLHEFCAASPLQPLHDFIAAGLRVLAGQQMRRA